MNSTKVYSSNNLPHIQIDMAESDGIQDMKNASTKYKVPVVHTPSLSSQMSWEKRLVYLPSAAIQQNLTVPENLQSSSPDLNDTRWHRRSKSNDYGRPGFDPLSPLHSPNAVTTRPTRSSFDYSYFFRESSDIQPGRNIVKNASADDLLQYNNTRIRLKKIEKQLPLSENHKAASQSPSNPEIDRRLATNLPTDVPEAEFTSETLTNASQNAESEVTTSGVKVNHAREKDDET